METANNNSDYRIVDIEQMKVNGRPVKVFKAFKKFGFGYMFCGYFSAPVGTPDVSLWRNVRDAEEV